jgi:hypothetical protein
MKAYRTSSVQQFNKNLIRGFPKPSLEQSPLMRGVPLIGKFPPKHNNNANGVRTKFSRQIGDHTVKGSPSSGCHLNNTRFVKRNMFFKRV